MSATSYEELTLTIFLLIDCHRRAYTTNNSLLCTGKKNAHSCVPPCRWCTASPQCPTPYRCRSSPHITGVVHALFHGYGFHPGPTHVTWVALSAHASLQAHAQAQSEYQADYIASLDAQELLHRQYGVREGMIGRRLCAFHFYHPDIVALRQNRTLEQWVTESRDYMQAAERFVTKVHQTGRGSGVKCKRVM